MNFYIKLICHRVCISNVATNIFLELIKCLHELLLTRLIKEVFYSWHFV